MIPVVTNLPFVVKNNNNKNQINSRFASNLCGIVGVELWDNLVKGFLITTEISGYKVGKLCEQKQQQKEIKNTHIEGAKDCCAATSTTIEKKNNRKKLKIP